MVYRGAERRTNSDRRDGYERRTRVSDVERRIRPQGRRYVDKFGRLERHP